MSKHAGLKLAVAALIVGSGLYLALEWLKPYHHVEVKLEGLVPAEQVFAATASTATDSDSAAPASTPPSDTAAAVEAPAAAPPAEADTAAVQGSASSTAATTTASPAAAPAPAPVKPAVQVAEKKTASKSKPAEAAAKSNAVSHAPEDSGKAWWLSSTASGFSVIYAGSAAFRRALVVMGNAPFANADSANAAIKVLDASGKAVAGHWELNSVNPSMLVFPLTDNGVYRVQIGAALSDRQNRELGSALQGSIQVR